MLDDEQTTQHRVDARDVREAMDRLGLGDGAINVARATALLTALGVTVTHDAPVTGWQPAEDDDAVPSGDVADLLEVRASLRHRGPTTTVEQFRARPVRHRAAARIA